MQNFAKLFLLDDIGQVLVTLEKPQGDDECAESAGLLRFRIPDNEGHEIRAAVIFTSPGAARSAFDAMSEAWVADVVRNMALVKTWLGGR